MLEGGDEREGFISRGNQMIGEPCGNVERGARKCG